MLLPKKNKNKGKCIEIDIISVFTNGKPDKHLIILQVTPLAYIVNFKLKSTQINHVAHLKHVDLILNQYQDII